MQMYVLRGVNKVKKHQETDMRKINATRVNKVKKHQETDMRKINATR